MVDRKLRLVVGAPVLGLLIATVFVSQAWADSAVALDQWYEFSFTTVGVDARGCSPEDPLGGSCVPGIGTVNAGEPAWTFVAPASGVTLKVTNGFIIGDQFEVFDFGASIGTTSAPVTPGACSTPNDPEVCFADPNVSHGAFPLGPGAHSITIRPVALVSGGAAFFKAETVTPVGGEILGVDFAALFIAGSAANIYTILPILGGIAGAAIYAAKRWK